MTKHGRLPSGRTQQATVLSLAGCEALDTLNCRETTGRKERAAHKVLECSSGSTDGDGSVITRAIVLSATRSQRAISSRSLRLVKEVDGASDAAQTGSTLECAITHRGGLQLRGSGGSVGPPRGRHGSLLIARKQETASEGTEVSAGDLVGGGSWNTILGLSILAEVGVESWYLLLEERWQILALFISQIHCVEGSSVSSLKDSTRLGDTTTLPARIPHAIHVAALEVVDEAPELLHLFLVGQRRSMVDERSGPLGMGGGGRDLHLHRIEKMSMDASSLALVHGQHDRRVVLAVIGGVVGTVRSISRGGLARKRRDRRKLNRRCDLGGMGNVSNLGRMRNVSTGVAVVVALARSVGVTGMAARVLVRYDRARNSGTVGRLGGIHRLETLELASSVLPMVVHPGRILPSAVLLALASVVGRCRSSDGLENAIHVVTNDVAIGDGILDDGVAGLIDPILGGDVLLDLALHAGVPMILDGIVGTPGKELGNLGPLVAEALVMGDDETVFLLAPGHLADGGIEMVVPTLAALLADAAGKLGSDLAPAFGAVSLDEAHDLDVLLLGPGSLESTGLLASADAGDLVVPPHTFGRLAPIADHVGDIGPIQISDLVPLPLRGIMAIGMELEGIGR